MSKRELALSIAKTDNTFELQSVQGVKCWVGKCIHCNSKIMLSADGALLSATIEHILPVNHGGTDDIRNVALACRACNNSKGWRLDLKRRTNQKLQEMITRLTNRRSERWREPV